MRESAHQCKRFLARMAGSFQGRRPAADNNVGKRRIRGRSSESACSPAPEIRGHGLFGQWFAIQEPGFVAGFRKNGHPGKFPFRALWSVAAAKTRDEPHDFSPAFKPRFPQDTSEKIGKKRR